MAELTPCGHPYVNGNVAGQITAARLLEPKRKGGKPVVLQDRLYGLYGPLWWFCLTCGGEWHRWPPEDVLVEPELSEEQFPDPALCHSETQREAKGGPAYGNRPMPWQQSGRLEAYRGFAGPVTMRRLREEAARFMTREVVRPPTTWIGARQP